MMLLAVVEETQKIDWEGGVIVFGALFLIVGAVWLFLDGKNR